MNADAGRPGLYLHVPFCAVKCFYCDFTAFSGQASKIGRYLEALRGEAALYGGEPDTLYVGGGTPSELPAESIARLLAGVRERFGPPEAMREATFEANPESLDDAKLEALRRGGVGRLSLGLEAAQDRILSSIGRRHGWVDFERVFKSAKARGFELCVDLMAGLPGQSLADALEGLDRVLGLGPGHISLYALQVEERTLFYRKGVSSDEDLVRDMLEACRERLLGAGYAHYEISNFSLPGRESVHNAKYWRSGEYIGLGCGAAGFLGGERYQNEDRLDAYCGRVERGERPVAFSERLSGKERLGERLMLGLRLLDGYEAGACEREAFSAEIEGLRRRGLLSVSREGARALLRLSPEGTYVSNAVFREFVPPFAAQAVPQGACP